MPGWVADAGTRVRAVRDDQSENGPWARDSEKIIDEHGGRVVLDNAQPARVTLHFPTLPTANLRSRG
jgi:hypothetical protein